MVYEFNESGRVRHVILLLGECGGNTARLHINEEDSRVELETIHVPETVFAFPIRRDIALNWAEEILHDVFKKCEHEGR